LETDQAAFDKFRAFKHTLCSFSWVDYVIPGGLRATPSLRALVAVTLYWFPSLYLGKIS
jgi:hypothetical protein